MKYLIFLSTLWFGSAVSADLPDTELTSYIESQIESGTYVGMIVGLVDGDEIYVQSFGEKVRGSGDAPDERSIFEISSISKTFAATLLAGLVVDGGLSLDDPANDHLPAGVAFSSADGRDITLRDLAAHQSGLPYMPDDIEPTDGPNPYAQSTDADLVSAINTFTPTSPPGEGYSYSAFAYGTIAHVLRVETGAAFEDLVASRLTAPLGMRDTVFALDVEQSSRLAPGYTPEGNVAVPLEQGVFRAAGSMYSSLHDLIIWVRANMRPDNSALGKSLKMTHEIQNTIGTIGLAWHKSDGYDDRSQYGTAHGYRAYVGFLANGSKGAVVLANTKANVVDIGSRLLFNKSIAEFADP